MCEDVTTYEFYLGMTTIVGGFFLILMCGLHNTIGMYLDHIERMKGVEEEDDG